MGLSTFDQIERQWSSLISDNQQFIRDERRRETRAASQMNWWTRTRTRLCLNQNVHCSSMYNECTLHSWSDCPLERERNDLHPTRLLTCRDANVSFVFMSRIFVLMKQFRALPRLVQLILENGQGEIHPIDQTLYKYPLLNVLSHLSYLPSMYNRGGGGGRYERPLSSVTHR